MTTEGRKDDNAKPRYTLLPFFALRSVVAVLEHGAKKYGEFNWVRVGDGRRRYLDAALRHIVAYAEGEVLDQESGLPHLAHSVCSLLFVLSLEHDV